MPIYIENVTADVQVNDSGGGAPDRREFQAVMDQVSRVFDQERQRESLRQNAARLRNTSRPGREEGALCR